MVLQWFRCRSGTGPPQCQLTFCSASVVFFDPETVTCIFISVKFSIFFFIWYMSTNSLEGYTGSKSICDGGVSFIRCGHAWQGCQLTKIIPLPCSLPLCGEALAQGAKTMFFSSHLFQSPKHSPSNQEHYTWRRGGKMEAQVSQTCICSVSPWMVFSVQ